MLSPARSSKPYWATTPLYSQASKESSQPTQGLAPAAVTRPSAFIPLFRMNWSSASASVPASSGFAPTTTAAPTLPRVSWR